MKKKKKKKTPRIFFRVIIKSLSKSIRHTAQRCLKLWPEILFSSVRFISFPRHQLMIATDSIWLPLEEIFFFSFHLNMELAVLIPNKHQRLRSFHQL